MFYASLCEVFYAALCETLTTAFATRLLAMIPLSLILGWLARPIHTRCFAETTRWF
jgi:hypothetical protein